jgi:uncharacterized membrane protein
MPRSWRGFFIRWNGIGFLWFQLMRSSIVILLFFVTGCTLPAEREAREAARKSDTSTTTIQTSEVNTAASEIEIPDALPAVKRLKKPGGIYQTVLPINGKMQQTIAFMPDYTFQLEEKYGGAKKDSVVISEGTWMPSDGFIWLYKDQVVRGRYSWLGDTLQYYSPTYKKNFSMRSMQDAKQNVAWRNKGREGVVVFGVGNEPFWNLTYTNKDSISFLLLQWDQPLTMKVNSSFTTSDSSGYIAQNDSTQLRVTFYPCFCSDGMSDFIYRNKVRVQYNQQLYSGCGIVYK